MPQGLLLQAALAMCRLKLAPAAAALFVFRLVLQRLPQVVG